MLAFFAERRAKGHCFVFSRVLKSKVCVSQVCFQLVETHFCRSRRSKRCQVENVCFSSFSLPACSSLHTVAYTFEVPIRFVHRAAGTRWHDGVLRAQAGRQKARNTCSTQGRKAGALAHFFKLVATELYILRPSVNSCLPQRLLKDCVGQMKRVNLTSH